MFKKKTREYPCIFFYNLVKIFSKRVSTLVYFQLLAKFLYKIPREYPCFFSKSQSKKIPKNPKDTVPLKFSKYPEKFLKIRVVSSSKGTVLSKVTNWQNNNIFHAKSEPGIFWPSPTFIGKWRITVPFYVLLNK